MTWQTAVLIMSSWGGKRVQRIVVRLCAEDLTGNINLTDLMLQGGVLATIWSGHTSEIRFSFEQ